MKFSLYSLIALVALGALVLAGSVGIQLAVLGVTLGIFFGTLSLRSPAVGEASSTGTGT